MPKYLAVDTECTGLDLNHAARPYFVTTCSDDGEQINYEWNVDPWKREVCVPPEDVIGIRELIDSADRIVCHNGKFDVTALEAIGVYPKGEFPWEKLDDTIIAHHCLWSARLHSLDSLTVQLFSEDIEHFEKEIAKATQEARRLCRTKRFIEEQGNWLIGQAGLKGHPSIRPTASGKSAKTWKADMWLPLTVARELEYPPDHPWWNVLEEYASADSYWTLACWLGHDGMPGLKDYLAQRGLDAIYRARMETLPAAQDMEMYGVTGDLERSTAIESRFTKSRNKRIFDLKALARKTGYPDLVLPKSGNNASLLDYAFNHLKLPVIKRTDTGTPAFDKDVIEEYSKTLEGTQKQFIDCLTQKRDVDTALSYIEGYKRFWIEEDGTFRLFPNLNPTGTVQLRWSHSNPNSANISKKKGYNLRFMFGPTPDEEWYSLDYQNVELRIPTFKAGEEKLMDVFLRPTEAPYFGSYHLVVFDALHPEMFAEYGIKCKDEFESTWYQWVKNGNFSLIYGAGRRKVDATYHMKDAYDVVRNNFPKIAELSDKQIWYAKKHGYVQTVPDVSVDPTRGFPVMAGRSDDGGVLPTTPLNYFVSGTAMWITGRAMSRTHKQIKEWRKEGINARTVLQVHDELVFSFPKSKVHPSEDLAAEKAYGSHLPSPRDYKSNLGRVRVLQRLMEQGGDDVGVPTPVGVELNEVDWATVSLKC